MVVRVFVDTSFAVGLLNRRDKYHGVAVGLFPVLLGAKSAFVTEVVLLEIANAMAALERRAADRFMQSCYDSLNCCVLSLAADLWNRGRNLYRTRTDKFWGLADCISFAAMEEHGLRDALTADHHFEQAGFSALMRSA